MGKYTLEIRELLNDPLFTLFDFDYNFYLEDHKQIFEEKFIDNYFYSEIGFETVHRFKQRLRNKLNLIDPYYKQLYETELKSKDIQFLLNKDLEETFTRNTENNNNTLTQGSNNSSTNTDYKESSIENGNADVNLASNNLTTVNNNLDTIDSSSNVDSESNGSSSEETKLISKGNIGTTSSATLLKEWRSVLINIDEMIIDECSGLFMGVF